MDNLHYVALLEAIFFLEGEPLTEASLAKRAGCDVAVVQEALQALHERYAEPSSGVELTQLMGGWVIVPKKTLWDDLKDSYGKKNVTRLSRSAMETLSIIAYSQPVTRAEIEGIRGVSSDTMIRLLIEKDLIKEVGKKDVPGKPIQYGTTKTFLKVFRLNSIADLPKLSDTEKERFELAR